MIQTEDLTKDYGGFRALDGVSLSVAPGQLFGFLGPNGSGKTTTILLLLGILRPTSGRAELLGSSSRDGLRTVRTRVGAALAGPKFYEFLSGEDNLALAAHAGGLSPAGVPRALELVGLTDRARSRFGTYSLGMKQRLALAAALVGDPDLIILDEPTNGLDPDGIRAIRELILELHGSGKTIFLSSHQLSEVQRLCTHVGIISKGRLSYVGALDELRRAGDGNAVYLAGPSELDTQLDDCPFVAAYHRRDEGYVATLAGEDAATLNTWLASRGAAIHELKRLDRDLEDIYFSMVDSPSEPADVS